MGKRSATETPKSII